MDNPVDLAVGGVLVDVHLPDLTVRVAVPLIHLAVAGVVDLDQRRSARSIKRLPLLWLAIEVLIQGDAHHLALLERLPLVGIAVAVGVFFEPFKLLVGAVEKLLLERAVAVFVAGHALQAPSASYNSRWSALPDPLVSNSACTALPSWYVTQ